MGDAPPPTPQTPGALLQLPPPAQPMIRPIPLDSIQQIVAGQVIFDLASAVKELVDNSLDAGSTCINIRLFGQGLDIIEVSDDGYGVPAASRPFLATLHATSKLQRLEDLYCDGSSDSNNNNNNSNGNNASVRTLGFRGEALFALANICQNLVVLTRTADEALAQKLEFGKHGLPRQSEQSQLQFIPRKVGTTVAAVRLWDALPVRRLDLQRRFTEQRQRLLRLLRGYAVLCTGVRLHWMDYGSATNEKADATREQTILETPHGTTQLSQTISAVLGASFLANLMPVVINLNDMVVTVPKEQENAKAATTADDSLAGAAPSSAKKVKHEHNDKDADDKAGDNESDSDDDDDDEKEQEEMKWKIKGYISKPPESASAAASHNSSSSKRGGTSKHAGKAEQYYALNGRPVDLPQVTRLLQSLWKARAGPAAALSKSQPSAIWHITLPNHVLDVNVTPDKRTVQFTHEAQFLSLIEEAVRQAWRMQGDFQNGGDMVVKIGESSQVKVEEDVMEEKKEQQMSEEKAEVSAAQPQQSSQPEEDVYGYGTESVETTPIRGRFNRRYAFSTDVGTIKLQHQFDDGRRRRMSTMDHKFYNYDPSKMKDLEEEDADDNQDIFAENLDKGEEEDAKPEASKQRTSLAVSVTDSETTVPASLQQPQSHSVTPSPAHIKQSVSRTLVADERTSTVATVESTSPTLSEQRVWRAMQRKFNKPADNDLLEPQQEEGKHEVQESVEEVPPSMPTRRQQRTQFLNQFRSRVVSTGEDTSNITTTTKTKNDTPTNRLERFGFTPKTTQESSSSTKGSTETVSKRVSLSQARPLRSSFCPSKRQASCEMSMAEAAAAVAELDSGDEDDDDKEVVQAPPSFRPSKRQASSRMSMAEAAAAVAALDSGDEDDEEDGDNVVVLDKSLTKDKEMVRVTWSGFSTAQVTEAATKERLRIRDRKRRFQECLAQNGRNDDMEIEGTPTKEKIVSLRKGDFEKMEIVGQFNLGFIIAKTADNHLYILDQHACDEKYNFEKLCRETVIHEQRLIAPMALELSPVEESCILDNMDIFEQNGFRFKYDPSKPPRHRFSLIGLPHSGASDGRKAVQFGKDDVSALCSILSGVDEYDCDDYLSGGGTGADGSGMYGNNAVRRYAGRAGGDSADRVIARLPKAVAMFASRACRSSIMIGKALSNQEMARVVKKLENVEHPWNCPHGRPTMRHLGDLTAVLIDDERKVEQTIGNATVTVGMTQPEQA